MVAVVLMAGSASLADIVAAQRRSMAECRLVYLSAASGGVYFWHLRFCRDHACAV